MEENSIKSNLTVVQEMILDEEKLVTYVSLSKELCIHVNDSKYLLTEFVAETRKNQGDIGLNVSYIISGLSQNNKARTTVSSEKEIDQIRKSLKIVFFEHIYSVSKGLPNVDNVALLAVNKFEDFPLCTGLIKSSICVKRSSDEIGALKFSSQLYVSDPKLANVLPKKIKNGNIVAALQDKKSVSILQETKSEPIVKTEVVSPKKETQQTLASAKAKSDGKKNGVKSQKGIAGFFSKSNSAPSKTIGTETNRTCEPVIKREKESPKKSKIDEYMDIDERTPEPKIEIKNKELKPEIKKEQVTQKKSNEKLAQIKKRAKVDKKRKRVLHVSDSESDGEKDPFVDEPDLNELNHMSDDEIPPTPTINTVKITSEMVNPKKRRKVVDKTYTDEDGYILTKKVEVYENCSDIEEEASVKENIKAPPSNLVKQEKQDTSLKENRSKAAKKKISPPQKGKQATLMNFFKKV